MEYVGNLVLRQPNRCTYLKLSATQGEYMCTLTTDFVIRRKYSVDDFSTCIMPINDKVIKPVL